MSQFRMKPAEAAAAVSDTKKYAADMRQISARIQSISESLSIEGNYRGTLQDKLRDISESIKLESSIMFQMSAAMEKSILLYEQADSDCWI